MRLSTISEREAEALRAEAADPELRAQFARCRPPPGRSAEENLEMLWAMLKMLGPLLERIPPRRDVARGGVFIL